MNFWLTLHWNDGETQDLVGFKFNKQHLTLFWIKYFPFFFFIFQLAALASLSSCGEFFYNTINQQCCGGRILRTPVELGFDFRCCKYLLSVKLIKVHSNCLRCYFSRKCYSQTLDLEEIHMACDCVLKNILAYSIFLWNFTKLLIEKSNFKIIYKIYVSKKKWKKVCVRAWYLSI